MKTIQLILFTLFIINNGIAQDNSNTDSYIASNLEGTWEHISSSYPGGTIVTFQLEFQLYVDGTGICTEYKEKDTLKVTFQWEVKDSVIVLFMIDKRGIRIDTDSQFISFLSPGKMYLSELDKAVETGKVCYYRKKNLVVAEY